MTPPQPGDIVLVGLVPKSTSAAVGDSVDYRIRRAPRRGGVYPGHMLTAPRWVILYTHENDSVKPTFIEHLYSSERGEPTDTNWIFHLRRTDFSWSELRWAIDPFEDDTVRFGEPRLGIIGSPSLSNTFGTPIAELSAPSNLIDLGKPRQANFRRLNSARRSERAKPVTEL